MLISMKNEPCAATFEELLQKFLDFTGQLSDTQRFSEYFEGFYMARKEEWAACFRKGTGINTNMYVENFHKQLKHITLEGISNKRVDELVAKLLQYVTKTAFDRLVKVQKGKASSRVQDIRARHRDSQALGVESVKKVDSKTWRVPSQTTKEEYLVEELMEQECCQLKCASCCVCVHMFSCSCTDQLLRQSICKHIHLVRRSEGHHGHGDNATSSIARPMIPADDITALPPASRPMPTSSAGLLQSATDLTNKLTAKLTLMSPATLKQVICDLKTCMAKAEAMEKGESDKENFVDKRPSPHVRLVNPQIRFVSTKKKRPAKVTVGKPSAHQSLTIKESLKNGNIAAWFSERDDENPTGKFNVNTIMISCLITMIMFLILFQI